MISSHCLLLLVISLCPVNSLLGYIAPRNEDTRGLGILRSARPQLDLLFRSTAAFILCTDEEPRALGVCQNALA